MLNATELLAKRSLLATSPQEMQRIFMAEDESDLRLWSQRGALKTARDVQQSLLPLRTPVVPGLRIEARSTPALEVGGDHYNFFWARGGCLGVLIADVSGKGMPAALVATMLRATFRTLSYGNTDVGDVLARVNVWMAKSLRQGMFVTCTYGVLDTARRTFTWARAGHEPLLRAGQGGRIEILAPPGFPLGIADNAEFRRHLEVQRLQLEDGDFLLLFTDGLTEAMDAEGEEFGMHRILHALSRTVSSSPSRAGLELIEEALQAHIGDEPLADDLTLLSIAVG